MLLIACNALAAQSASLMRKCCAQPLVSRETKIRDARWMIEGADGMRQISLRISGTRWRRSDGGHPPKSKAETAPSRSQIRCSNT